MKANKLASELTISKITQFIIWSLGLLVAVLLLLRPSLPMQSEGFIEDRFHETSDRLLPGDTVTATFSFPFDNLEGLGFMLAKDPIAEGHGGFTADATDPASSSIRFEVFRDETLLAEQSLPLSVITPETFLDLTTPAQGVSGSEITVYITNTSTDPEVSFAMVTTTDPLRYEDYTDGYLFNEKKENGSLFCRFRYTVAESATPYSLFTALACTFLATLILSTLFGIRFKKS
jgi:hypothetical protein